MTLTKAKLSELRRIRDRATPGEWKWERQDWDNGDTSYEFQDTGRFIALRQSDYDQPMRAKFDAEYIAAFDPPTTGELLDAIEKMRDALTWANEMFEARDTMNAKVHCSPVRWSPVTERTRMALREVFGEGEV